MYAEDCEEEKQQSVEESGAGEHGTQGVFNLMVRVMDDSTECGVAARQHSMYDINLDSYCTRHMTPCFSLENPEHYVVDIFNLHTKGYYDWAILLSVMYCSCPAYYKL